MCNKCLPLDPTNYSKFLGTIFKPNFRVKFLWAQISCSIFWGPYFWKPSCSILEGQLWGQASPICMQSFKECPKVSCPFAGSVCKRPFFSYKVSYIVSVFSMLQRRHPNTRMPQSLTILGLSQCKITSAYQEPRSFGNPEDSQPHLAISYILIAFRKDILLWSI